MIEVGRAIVSRDVIEEQFLCDLVKCKGACCIEGDSGAPLQEQEAEEIEKNYHIFKKYMPEKHKKVIEKHGYSIIDEDGDLVTLLVDNRQCAYSYYNDQGILKCAIEKAHFEDGIGFRKPISCHLFPIRITQYTQFDAVNYQQLDICKPGRKCGQSVKLPLYKFLKEPLIKKYGKEWYQQLEVAAEYFRNI